MKINQNKLRNALSTFMLLGILVFLVSPASANAKSKMKYYDTYHNGLGGWVITNCQKGADFMDEHFSPWIYDGERKWFVDRIGVGFYTLYRVDNCKLYTNSFTVKSVLNALGVPRVSGYACHQQDVY